MRTSHTLSSADIWSLGLGRGLLPWAPGTWGSLLGLWLYVVVSMFPLSLAVLLQCVLVVFSFYSCQVTFEWLRCDHKAIVVDEVIGMQLALLGLPLRLDLLLYAFVGFRLLDILKPWPVCVFDQASWGWFGVMADDCCAGLLVCICLQCALLL